MYSAAVPVRSWRVIVPSDTVNLPGGCQGIYVGGAGNVALVGSDNTVVVFTAVPVGTILPCGAKRVNAALTTASLLIALY